MSARTRWFWAGMAGFFFVVGHVSLGLMPVMVHQVPALLAVLRPSLDTTVLLSASPYWLLVPPLRLAMHISYFEFARAFSAWAWRWMHARRVGRRVLEWAPPISLAISCLWPNAALDIALAITRSRRIAVYVCLASGVIVSTAVAMIVSSRFGRELRLLLGTLDDNLMPVLVLGAVAACTLGFAVRRLGKSIRSSAGEDLGEETQS